MVIIMVKKKGIEGIAGAAVSLVAFLIISPQTHPLFVDKEGKAFSGFASGNLGTKGLFFSNDYSIGFCNNIYGN